MKKIILAGLILFSIAIVFSLLSYERKLTENEIDQLKMIFFDHVDYQKVEIRTIKMPQSIGAIVIGNHIFYEKNYYRSDFSDDVMKMSLLVHEVAHVWVNQEEGWWRTFAALKEHHALGQDVYAISDLSEQLTFEELGIEQQARVFSQHYINLHHGFGDEKVRKWVETAFTEKQISVASKKETTE